MRYRLTCLTPLLVGDGPPAGIDLWHIAPASVSHETHLFFRLLGGRDVPEGFHLMQALIEEIRAGKIDLAPTKASGWYDHQTWALQPLLLPEKTPEASHLICGEEYRKHLEELFKGTLALTRETHVKQLAVPAAKSILVWKTDSGSFSLTRMYPPVSGS